jgi:hypothetical protein
LSNSPKRMTDEVEQVDVVARLEKVTQILSNCFGDLKAQRNVFLSILAAKAKLTIFICGMTVMWYPTFSA